MVHANEKDEAPKSKLSPEKDEVPLSSSSIMEEEEDEDEEEYYEEEKEVDEEEENLNNGGNAMMEEEEDEDEEECYEEEEEVDDEEEKLNNGGNAMVVVNGEELGTNKENAVKDEKKAKEPKNSEKSGEKSKSKKKRRRPRNKNRKHVEQKESVTLAVNGEQPESSNRKKGSKRVESMGMVFMCSSKTKTDCFRYKILGLPENKKDQVLKIYRGMRLFLFDVDLRLMYGIFKAAGPGGYNIEPRAFKSELPSQVRFTVLEDCLPLAEEKFKGVLKENYYGRNKNGGLRSLLKSDQVKELCKLFKETGRGGARKSAVKARRTKLIKTHRIRPDKISRNQPDDRNTSRPREKRERRGRDEERRPRSRSPPVREKRRPRSRSPLVGEKRRYTDYYHDHPHVLYDREPPAPRYHLAQPTATIGSQVRVYTYERQPLDIPPHRVLDQERSRDLDPFPVYSREPPLYRDAVYAAPPKYHFVSRDYSHPPAIQTPEYRITGGSRVANYRDVEIASDYRSSALPLLDYRSALPLPDYRSGTHYGY